MTVRLKNEATGVVVSVSDDTATRLGSEWVAEKPKAAPKPARKKSEDKSDED